MASFGTVDLLPSSARPGGGVFYLGEAATDSAVLRLDTDSEVEVVAGCRFVVARRVLADSYEAAKTRSLEEALKGLDLLSTGGVLSATIAGLATEHLVWWKEGDSRIIRYMGEAAMPVRIGPIHAVVSDASGQIRLPEPPPLMWHPSMRFFRQSQVTNDLFDAFRNLFLALESVLSTIAPSDPARSEGEGQWLRRALVAAHERYDLAPYAEESTDPIDSIYQEMYVRSRTAVFHAKQGRSVHLPGDEGSKKVVRAAHARLSRIVLHLIEGVTGTRFGSSGMSAGWFRDQVSKSGMDQLHFSDDEGPFEPSATELPHGGAAYTADLRRVEQGDDRWLVAHTSEVEVSELVGAGLPFVSKLFTSSPGVLGAAFDLEARLDPRGFDIFRVQVGPRLINARVPRSTFLT